jgi:hypothetical protein
MPPAPNLLMALVVIISMVLCVVVMSFGAVWARLRKISRPLADTARLVDDLAQRQRTMESLLERLDATGTGTTVPASSSKLRHARTLRRGDQAESSALSGPTLIAVPNLAATPSEVTAAASAAAELARRFGAIWAMSEMGASAEAIARETGQPIGQIELILGLRRQLASGAGGPTENRT